MGRRVVSNKPPSLPPEASLHRRVPNDQSDGRWERRRQRVNTPITDGKGDKLLVIGPGQAENLHLKWAQLI